jgi:hypothetical protein
LRFKIVIDLKDNDYVRMKNVLDKNPNKPLELLSGEDFEFVKFSPFFVSVEGFGYSLNGMVSFQQPIGLKVFKFLELDKETSRKLSVNYRNIKLSKIVSEASELQSEIKECLNLLERIFNKVCSMNYNLIGKMLSINAESLDKQLDLIIRATELEKRGETPKPFGTIHAKGRKDAKVRSCTDLVPIYLEKDKAYLYEDKNVYILLPRDFVRKLLKFDNSTLTPSEQFTDEELQVLRKFSMRNYVKKDLVAGKTFFHSLNEETRKVFLKGLRNL